MTSPRCCWRYSSALILPTLEVRLRSVVTSCCSDGHPTCVDGVTVTYDALGRAVEQGLGGTCSGGATSYRQIIYDPQGKKVALANGQNLMKAFIPLPGGDTAIYNASGLVGYRHADWLGSSRLTTGFSTPRTIYDQGTVTVKVANYTAAVTYNGCALPCQSSTAASIVTALVAIFQNDSNSPVSATVGGGSCNPRTDLCFSLTSKRNGTDTNYNLNASPQSNFPGYFSPPSFTPQPSGPTLTGGTATTPGSGTVQITGTEGSASAGSAALSATAYAPFGENYASTGPNDLSFTGQHQDTTLGIYDFMFREQAPNQGRWISPDPAGMAAASLMDPQSFNRYAYVSNSPLDSLDDDGLCTIIVAGIDTDKTNPFISALAAVKGFVVVYDYGKTGKLRGALGVLGRDFAGNVFGYGSSDLAQAIEAYSNDPNGIQLVGHSGGVQVLDTTLNSSPALQRNVTDVVRMSPGLGIISGILDLGAQGTRSSSTFHGGGFKDHIAGVFNPFRKGDSLPCGHDFGCEFLNLPLQVSRRFTSCSNTPQQVVFGGRQSVGQSLTNYLFRQNQGESYQPDSGWSDPFYFLALWSRVGGTIVYHKIFPYKPTKDK